LYIGFIESFDFYYTNYFYTGRIFSFPISVLFLFLFFIIFCKDKFFFSYKNLNLFLIILYSFFIIILLIFFHFLNIKIIKNIINLNIFFFLLTFFDFFLKKNIKLDKILIFYQFALSIICVLIMISKNLNIHIFVPDKFMHYLKLTDYDVINLNDFFLNFKVTSYQDYFPFVVIVGLISSFATFKNNTFVSIFSIFVFILQLLDFFKFNTGLIICAFFFIPLLIFFYFLRKIFKKEYYIYFIILFVFLLYWSLIYSGLAINLHLSLDKRSTLILYMSSQLDFKYFLLPFFLIKGEGNMHNDFIDMFFSFGPIFALYFYYLISEKLKIIYYKNIILFTLFFLVFFIEGLVQNNLFSIYLNSNLAFILSALINYLKKNKY